MSVATSRPPTVPAMPDPVDLRALFHRLNNQLGVILAHAELLEHKAGDVGSRARAAQVVASALDAMSTVKEIRQQAAASQAAESGQF